jgi:hypothetical protein
MVGLLTMAQLLAFANSVEGPRDPRLRYKLPLAVTVDDFDYNGQREGRRFKSLMDLGRLLPWMRGKRALALAKKGWEPQLGAVLSRFARPLDEKQNFRLSTELVTWDDVWLYFEQCFWVADQVHATVFCQARFETAARPVLTEEALALVEIEDVLPPPPCSEAMREWIDLHGAEAERAWDRELSRGPGA